MHNGEQKFNTPVPKELSRDAKSSQKQMGEGGAEDQKLLELSLYPKPQGDTKEDQLNFNMAEIDKALRNEFPDHYGKGSFISLCLKIAEIKQLAQQGTTHAAIKTQTQASLKLIELVTRTPSLSDEEIDEELRSPEKIKQFTGKTHEELKKIVQEIREMESKSSLADIVRDSKASIRLISLATEKPNLDIQQIDQAIHTPLTVTQTQALEATLMPAKLMEKVKEIKALAKLKSLSEVLQETKASLTLIELALKDKTITSDEGLKQALTGGVPAFDSSLLENKKIVEIRNLAAKNIPFPKIVEQSKVPLRLVAIITAKKPQENKQIPQGMNTVSWAYSEAEIKQLMQQPQLSSENELKLGPAEFSKKIKQVRELLLEGRHPSAIQTQLKVSFQLIELVGREQLALDEMLPKLRDKRSKQDPDFTGWSFSELDRQVAAIRQGFQEHKPVGQIMTETKSTIRLIELAFQQPELKLADIEREIRNPASDPDFDGMSYRTIRSLVRNIREAHYEPPLPLLIPPVITPPPLRRPSIPELKTVELKVIPTPKLRHWEYSSTVRMEQTFESARRQAAPLIATARFKAFKAFEAVELETHFKQMTKNNREPEALELYLFFKPLFESQTVDGQCTALLLLHRRQDKRIRQLILTVLQGVLKTGREQAIERLMDYSPSNFIELLETHLNSKEKNNKKIRDFILAHYKIFEKHHGKLSLTQYGFKKLIVIFQLFKTKLAELAPNSSVLPTPMVISLRQLCKSTKQAKILVDIFKNSRKGLISGEITPSEENKIIYWLLKEGYGLSFIERYCLESKTETLVHEIFFTLLQNEQRFFESRLNHPSIETMSLIFAAEHFGRHKNDNILVDETLARQELNLTNMIHMAFSDDIPLPPNTPSSRPSSQGSINSELGRLNILQRGGSLSPNRFLEKKEEKKEEKRPPKNNRFLTPPVQRSDNQISTLSALSKPPITLIVLALYFLNLKNEFIPEKIRDSLAWMLTKDSDKFWRFVLSLLEAPIFDSRFLDRREKLIAEIAKVLTLGQNKLLPDFLAEGFAKNLSGEDKDQLIAEFLQAADHVFTMDILSGAFAYNPNIRNAKLKVYRLLTELISADVQLKTILPENLEDIVALETFINKTICDLSAVCELNQMAHLVPLRFNLELSKMTLLKCVFAFPFHLTTLADDDYFSRLQAPNVPCTDESSSKRLSLWKIHRKNIFQTIFADALADTTFAEKHNFYKFFYYFCKNKSLDLLTEVYTWCEDKENSEDNFTDPSGFFQLIEELIQPSEQNLDDEKENSGNLQLPSFPEAFDENDQIGPLQLGSKKSKDGSHTLSRRLPEDVSAVKFVPLMGTVMQGLVNLINALKAENHRKSSKSGLEPSFKQELCKVLNRLISSQRACWYFLEIMNSADLMEEFASLISSESKLDPDEKNLDDKTVIFADPFSLKSVFLRTFQAFDSLRQHYHYTPHFARQVALVNFGLHYLGTGNLSPFEQDAVATWLKESWENRNKLQEKNISGHFPEFIQLLVKWWPYQSPDIEYFKYLEKFTQAADSILLFKNIIATIGVYLLTKTEDLQFDFILLTPSIELFKKAYIALGQDLKPDAIIKFLKVLLHHFDRIDNFLHKIYLNEHHQYCLQFTDRLVELRGSIITIFIEINKAIKFNPTKNLKNELAIGTANLSPIIKKTRELLITTESPSVLQEKILSLTTRALQTNRFATHFMTGLTEQDQDDPQSGDVGFRNTQKIVGDSKSKETKSNELENSLNSLTNEDETDETKDSKTLIDPLKNVHPKVLTASLYTLIRQCRRTPHNLLPLNYLEKIKYFVSNYLRNILFHGAKNAPEAIKILQFKVWPSNLDTLGNQKKVTNWREITSSDWLPQLDVYQYVCNLLGMPTHEDERQIAYTIETMHPQRLREEIIFQYVQEGVKQAFNSLASPSSEIMAPSIKGDSEVIAIDLEPFVITSDTHRQLEDRLRSSKQGFNDGDEDSPCVITNLHTMSRASGAIQEEEEKSEAQPTPIRQGTAESARRQKYYNIYLHQLMIGFLKEIEVQVLKFITIKGNGFTALLETEYTAFLRSAVMFYAPENTEFDYFCNEQDSFLFLQILDILKNALVSKLDESAVDALKQIFGFYEDSPLLKKHPHFINKCLKFLDRYVPSDKQRVEDHKGLGKLNSGSSAAETTGQPEKLSALAAIGSIGCPISSYLNIQSQLAHLNEELATRQKVLQLSQNRTEWSAEIEAVLGRPPESIEYISQVIIRIFSAIGESYPPFLALSHQLTFSEQIVELFTRARQGLESQSKKLGIKLEIKNQLDQLLKLVSDGLEDDDDLEEITWIKPSESIRVHLMQAAVLMKVAQAFNNYKVHASVAKAAVMGLKLFVENLLLQSPLNPGLSGKESRRLYQYWHTCYQVMLYLAKIIVFGDIKRLELYDSTQSKISKQLSLDKQYQQMLEAPFGYEDSNNSQLNMVLKLLSNTSLTSEPEGTKAPDWLNKFLKQWNSLLFPIIYIPPTESEDLELIANLGREFEYNLTAESKTLSQLMPFVHHDKENKENKYEKRIEVIDSDEPDKKSEFQRKNSRDPFAFIDDSKEKELASLPKKLASSLPEPTLHGLWLKIISSHPQLQNSALLEKIESYRLVMDGPYQAYFAGETLRILFTIILHHPNKFRGYCLIEGLQQVFDQFKVDETQPFANLFAKMKFRLPAFRAQYSFDIEEIIFSGICVDFSFDIKTGEVDERLLTSTADEDRVVLLIKTLLNSDLFEGAKGENTRRIMKEFINFKSSSKATIKLEIFNTVLKLLFPKMEKQIELFINFLNNSPSSQPKMEKALFALLAQISQVYDPENPQLISSFIDGIESQLIIAFHDRYEDDNHPKTILRELEIYCHARDIHKQLKSSTNWNQLAEKSIQRRITDFWHEPSHLMAARIMHILGIKVLSDSQCRFLFKTKSKPEILESIISSFVNIDSMGNNWIETMQPHFVDVFNILLSKLLGGKIGNELTIYVNEIRNEISKKFSKKSIDVRALYEFMLCACILRTPAVAFSYKKKMATDVLLRFAGYLILTKTTAEQSAVFRNVLDLITIMKKENLLGIEDVGVIESIIGTNEYDLLRAYIEHRQNAITPLSSYPEEADRYQVLYSYSFIAEKIANYTYQSKKPLANVPALTENVKKWHNKIKTKIKEEVPVEYEAKRSRNSLLNQLLLEAGKMLQLAQQYPTVVNDKLGTKPQFISGLLELINKRISNETRELKEGDQFSDILESKTVKKYLMELHRIQKILFAENPSFSDSVSPEIFENFKASISGMQPMEIWTQTCWFFFYCKSTEENAEFEQLALAWLSSTAPEELVKHDYLKLNCVLNYIEARVEKDYQDGQISNVDLTLKVLEARKLVNQTAPKGSLINQLYVARLSIKFIETGNPKVLDDLSSCMFPLVVDDKIHVFKPSTPLMDSDDLNGSNEIKVAKKKNVFEEDDSSPLLLIKDEKENHNTEQVKILQATKLLLNYYRICFNKQARDVLANFSSSIEEFSDSSKQYLFNLVKLVFSQLGALEQSSVRLDQWKKLLHEMFDDAQPSMPAFTVSLSYEQQTIKSLLISLNNYFDFNIENGCSFYQQILVGMLLALQKHRLNPSRRAERQIRTQDIEQIKDVLSIAQIPDNELTDANTWTRQLGLEAFKELEPLIVSFLSANHLFKALGVSYSVVSGQFTEDEKPSNLPEEFHALVRNKFLTTLGNRPFDEVVKFSQWAGKSDGLEILLTELLSLFLEENEILEKPLIEHLVASSNVSEGIYKRIITLLFSVFKDKLDYQQKMMDYLSLDAAIKLQHQLRSNDGSDFKKFGRAIQRRTLEAYYLYMKASSTICQITDPENPAYLPDPAILKYIELLILYSERTHGLNSAFYGFYELFRIPYSTKPEALVLDHAENLIKLVDSATGLLLGEDRSLSLREPFQEICRVDDSYSGTTVPRHMNFLNEQLKRLQGNDAVLSFEELIGMVLSVAELDNYMQNRLQQLFLKTADYVQQRFLQKCMEAIETIDGDVRGNIISASLNTLQLEFRRRINCNERRIYVLTGKPENFNHHKDCFLLITTTRELLLVNGDGQVENLNLPFLTKIDPELMAKDELLITGTDLDQKAFQMIQTCNPLKFRSEELTILNADIKKLTAEQRKLFSRLAETFDKILQTINLARNCPPWIKNLNWEEILEKQPAEALVPFIKVICRLDELSELYIPASRQNFDSIINVDKLQTFWLSLLNYLNSRQVFSIESNPKDDKLHLIINPFKFRSMMADLQGRGGIPVFYYSIFTGNERGLLPPYQEIFDYRNHRPKLTQESKADKFSADEEASIYFSSPEDFLASPAAETSLLKNLIEKIDQSRLRILEREIKGKEGHPVGLLEFIFGSILDLISEEDQTIRPLVEGIIKDLKTLSRATPPEVVGRYWSEYVFKPFFNQRLFCQLVFEKLLTWVIFYSRNGSEAYLPIILELGVVAGVEPQQLLQIFDPIEGNTDGLNEYRDELRKKYPNLEFEIARQAFTLQMRLGQPVNLASLIQHFLIEEKESAPQFFTKIFAVSHNARSVITNILSCLGFNTSERYITVSSVTSSAKILVEYLETQKVIPLDLALSLITLLKRLPVSKGDIHSDDDLAFSCEDEIKPDKDGIANTLCHIYPDFLVKVSDIKELKDEAKRLDKDVIKRYSREVPSAMVRCFEDYMRSQLDIDEKTLQNVNPAWKFALAKYSLMMQFSDFFTKEITYGSNSIVEDLEIIFSKFKDIFGISVFDHPNLVTKLSDASPEQHQEIKTSYINELRERDLKEDYSIMVSVPYLKMCTVFQNAFQIIVDEFNRLFRDGVIRQLLLGTSMLTTNEKGRIKFAYVKHPHSIFEIVDLPQQAAIALLHDLCQRQMDKLEPAFGMLGFYVEKMQFRDFAVKNDLQIVYKKQPRSLMQQMKREPEVDALPLEAVIPPDPLLRIRYVHRAKKYPAQAIRIFGQETYRELLGLNNESGDLIMGGASRTPSPRRALFSAQFNDENDDEKSHLLTPGSPILTQTEYETKANTNTNDEAQSDQMLDDIQQILTKATEVRLEAKEIIGGGGLPKAKSFDLLPSSSLRITTTQPYQPHPPSPVGSVASNKEVDDELIAIISLEQTNEEENFGYS